MPLFFTISGYVFYLSKSYEKYKLKVLDFTFETKTTREKTMRNPKTNEKVLVKPKKKLRITQSSDWKRIFNGF
jgi:nucleoid DNA-binding protein